MHFQHLALQMIYEMIGLLLMRWRNTSVSFITGGRGGGVNECSLRAVFVQKGKQSQQLPPTLGTLIPHAHVHRTFYMARI